MMKIKAKIVLGIVLLSFAYCKRESSQVIDSTGNSSSVLVLNEGNFSWGNASVDLFIPENKEWRKSIFEGTNGRPIGDVLQSAKIINGDLWLVVNNSGKIEVVDTSNFKSIKTIGGLQSPRFLTEQGGTVYVTDLYAEKISTIKTSTMELGSSIKASGWTEQIVSSNQFVYFLNKDSNTVNVYNPSTQIAEKVQTTGKPFDLLERDGKVYVGTFLNDSLMISNLSNSTLVAVANGLGQTPSKLMYSDVNQSWYLRAENSIHRINSKGELELIFKLNSGSLYASEIIDQTIYLSDAKDYIQNSEMMRIDLNGNLIDKRESGKITNGFLWLE